MKSICDDILICSDLMNCLRRLKQPQSHFHWAISHKSHYFFAVLMYPLYGHPDILRSSQNINNLTRVSRLSFRFLWLWSISILPLQGCCYRMFIKDWTDCCCRTWSILPFLLFCFQSLFDCTYFDTGNKLNSMLLLLL